MKSYQLVGTLLVVIGEINSLVASESLTVLSGVKVEVILGGDNKVSIIFCVHTLAAHVYAYGGKYSF